MRAGALARFMGDVRLEGCSGPDNVCLLPSRRSPKQHWEGHESASQVTHARGEAREVRKATHETGLHWKMIYRAAMRFMTVNMPMMAYWP